VGLSTSGIDTRNRTGQDPKNFFVDRAWTHIYTNAKIVNTCGGGYIPRLLRFDSRCRFGVAKGAELDEDGYVFDHGAQGANQPGEVDEQVLFLLGVEEDLRMLAKIFAIGIFKK
jgi:hypothetical protein